MAIVRKLASQGAVSYTVHALDERMPERGIDVDDVHYILEMGEIDGDITPGTSNDEWKVCVVARPEWTSREAGVVTVGAVLVTVTPALLEVSPHKSTVVAWTAPSWVAWVVKLNVPSAWVTTV